MASDQSLDWLISVDDHVLEPPNLWVDRVAAKDRDRAPHMVSRRRHGVLGLRRQALSQLGPERGGREVQGGVQPRTGDLRRDAARVLRRQGPHRGHGPGRNPGLAVLPDDHPVLRAALHGGERPRVRVRLPAGLQRLDDRGVVRRRTRALHPPHPDPDVGSGAGGQGDGALRRQGRDGVCLLGESGPAGPADHPRQGPLLGSGDVDRHPSCRWSRACTSVRRRRCRRSPRTHPSWPIWRGGRSARRVRCCPGCSAACSPVSRGSRSRCPKGRSVGCRTSWSGPSRCSTSSASGCSAA